MKLINYFIEKINESENVKISYEADIENLEVKAFIKWDFGFCKTETFESKKELEAYLQGFHDALPF